MRTLITVSAVVAVMVLGGVVPALAATKAPTISCGTTPGFCPNPPDDASGGDWVVAGGGDF